VRERQTHARTRQQQKLSIRRVLKINSERLDWCWPLLALDLFNLQILNGEWMSNIVSGRKPRSQINAPHYLIMERAPVPL
jgi:hypothetical protein